MKPFTVNKFADTQRKSLLEGDDEDEDIDDTDEQSISEGID